MKAIIELTNSEIVAFAEDLNKFIISNENTYFPAKVNYAIQYNIKKIIDAATEVDNIRLNIGKHYGTYNEEIKGYNINPENFADAQQELEDLFKIKREFSIMLIKVEDLNSIQLTPGQMRSLLFMIAEPEEEEE